MRFVLNIIIGCALLLSGCDKYSADIMAAIKGNGNIYGDVYVVRPGDKLSTVANRAGVSQHYLAKLNKLASPYTIHIGQKLRLRSLPVVTRLQNNKQKDRKALNTTTTTTVTGSEIHTALAKRQNLAAPKANQIVPSNTNGAPKPAVSTVSKNPPVLQPKAVATTATVSKPQIKQSLPPTQTSAKNSWAWPANGPIIGTFASGKLKKNGLDIGGNKGTFVNAAGSGTVVYSGNGLRGYGNLIIIKHSNNFLSAYAHNKENIVKEGEEVKIGQQIAAMGNTGTDKVMLHFEIRHNGQPVDPVKLLPKKNT